MGILCLFIICIVFMALLFGWSDAVQIDFIIEVKNFSNPYYRMGILFESIERDDDVIQEEFSLGLFLVNFIFIYYKPKE